MEFDALHILLKILTGAAIGFCIGMTGVGGGSIVVPTLTLGFGLLPSVSVGTASLYTFLTKIYATYRHTQLKTISYRIAGIFLVGALPGNILASWYVNHRAGGGLDEIAKTQFQNHLKIFIAVVMLMSPAMLVLDLIRFRNRNNKQSIQNTDSAPPSTSLAKILLGILLGFCVGAVVGSTALGAGVLAIPVLLLCFGTEASKGIGSSILIGLVLTLVSSLIYSKGGQIHIPTAIWMSTGSIVGVYFGSKMTVVLSEKSLKAVVIGIIIFASLLMLLK